MSSMILIRGLVSSWSSSWSSCQVGVISSCVLSVWDCDSSWCWCSRPWRIRNILGISTLTGHIASLRSPVCTSDPDQSWDTTETRGWESCSPELSTVHSTVLYCTLVVVMVATPVLWWKEGRCQETNIPRTLEVLLFRNSGIHHLYWILISLEYGVSSGQYEAHICGVLSTWSWKVVGLWVQLTLCS